MRNSLCMLMQLLGFFNVEGLITLFEIFTCDVTIELIIYLFFMV